MNTAFGAGHNVESPASNSHFKNIHHPEVQPEKKEALVILLGLGESRRGKKARCAYFKDCPYDLFVVDYIERKSFEESKENAFRFFDENNISSYKKVHVLAYIMGTYVFNMYVNERGIQNIHTIIYDRSPIQERAPKVVAKKIPLVTKILAGNVVIDLSKIPYPIIEVDTNVHIGFIVEHKATSLMRTFKKATLELGEIDFDNFNYQQNYNDLIFVGLDHDEMYYELDVILDEMYHFFEFGQFSPSARRTPFNWDPFKKHKNLPTGNEL